MVVYTAIVFAFLGSEGDTRVIYLFLIGVPIAIAFLMIPKTGLIVLGLLVYSIDWISEIWSAIPREATWLIDILIGMFILRMIVTMPWRKTHMPFVEMWIYFALVFSIISALANGVSQLTYLIGFRVAFKYMLLFIMVYHLEISREWMRFFFKMLLVIALIQPAVILLQWRFTNWNSTDDFVGTFGAGQTGRLALFLLLIIGYYISKAIETRKVHFYQLLPFAWLTIAPILGEAKLYFLVLPIIVLFMLRGDFFRRPVVAIGISIIGIVMMFTADYVIRESGFWLEGRNPLHYVTTIKEVYETELDESSKIEGPRRIHQLVTATRLAANSIQDFFVGNGPGSVTMSFVAGGHSHTIDYFSQWRLSSISPTFAYLLIEYGYVGTFIMLATIFLIYLRGRVLRHSDDQELRIYGRWLEIIAFLYGIWTAYTSVLQVDSSSYLFWVTSALLVRLSYDEENRINMKATMERIAEARQPIRTIQSESAMPR